MEQRVRICDIAEELGLSTATVSNVIHGKTNKVSDATVQRVMALLERRQYIPSMAGILLAQNRSGIIGVFIHEHEKYEGHTLEDFFISSSLNCLSAEIESNGQFMMVKRAKHAEEIIRFASMWNMDGIVVIGFCNQDYTDLRSHMRIPFVVYDGDCAHPERIVNITIDNFDGGYQVGRHFRELGHAAALCTTPSAWIGSAFRDSAQVLPPERPSCWWFRCRRSRAGNFTGHSCTGCGRSLPSLRYRIITP